MLSPSPRRFSVFAQRRARESTAKMAPASGWCGGFDPLAEDAHNDAGGGIYGSTNLGGRRRTKPRTDLDRGHAPVFVYRFGDTGADRISSGCSRRSFFCRTISLG